MKLKKLVIFGFKSFADKTTLEFKEGVTAIVGPNGCGKSNVVDALRWVMGERDAKAIRGEKMTDILFNGTKTRSRTSYAEVSLVFDEINGAIPIPYEEVMVTRRLFADGNSGYFLNKKEVRLKDLHALFANTGIGKNAFWVFEQGKIDQIITLSPSELRTIFEDAAGISLYLFQKKEAKNRLKEVEQNILRATDRLAEKEKFTSLLRRQKEEAALYKAAKADLETHEKGLFYKRLKIVYAKIDELKGAHTDLLAQEKEKQLLFQEKEASFKESEKEAREGQQKKEAYKEQFFKLKSELALLEAKKAHLEKEGQEKEKKKVSLKAALSTLMLDLKKFETEHPPLVDEFDKLSSKHQALQNEYNESIEVLKTLEKQALEASQKERRTQESLFSLQKAHQKGQFDRTTLELKKESSLKEVTEGQNGLDALEVFLKARALKKGAQQEEMHALRLEFEAVKLALKEKQQECLSLDSQIGKVDQTIQLEMRRLAELQAKLSSLNALKSELEGASLGTKELYNAHPHLKPLAELLDVEGEFAEGVANALHPYSHTLVAEDEKALHSAIDYIKAHNLTNISLLCRTTLIQAPLKEGSLASLCSPQDLSIHLFNDTSLSESVQENPPLPSWSKEGFWITSKKLVTRTKVGEQNAFVRQGEIKKIAKEIEKQKKQHEAVLTEKGALLSQKTALQNQTKEVEAKLKQKEIKLMELKFHLQNETELLKKEQERKQSLLQKITVANASRLQIDAQKAKLEEELLKQESLLQEESRALQLLKKALELSKEQLTTKKTSLQVTEKELFNILTKKESLKSAISSSEYRQQQQKKQLLEIEKEVQEIESYLHMAKIELEKIPLSFTQSELIKVEKVYQEQCQRFSEQTSCRETLKADCQLLLEELNALKERSKGVEMKLFEQTVRKETLLRELQEKYEVQHLEEPPVELSLEKYEQKIRDLRATLSNLPSINPQASDEYAVEEQAMVTLQAQIKDLQGALLEVETLIGELDGKSNALFQETFAQVALHFRNNFQTLFKGGYAELLLKGSRDLLDEEVEIRCEPPGKSLKSLHLLSGGEKCLTAIALLFALFQVKPAPMCLLDEIDAPLDESNVRKFLDLIEPFAKETKIILVTHNKLTMEKANQLIGISMQEKGITKVLDFISIAV